MAAQITSSQKNAQKPIISEEVADQLIGAYQTIYRLMATYGDALTTPVSETKRQDWERVAVRGLNALTALDAHRKEQEVAAFRQGVKDAIEPHLDRARADKEEYDALSPTLKARLGAFQTYILVPVSDVSEVFGEGVEVPVQVKKLTDMGYKVSKGANGTFSLRVDLPKSILGDSAAK